VVFQEINERIAQEAEGFAQDMDTAELQASVRVLRQLSEKLKQSLT
jgi:hypothetical protein